MFVGNMKLSVRNFDLLHNIGSAIKKKKET